MVKEVEIRGAAAFDRAAVLRIVGLRPGERLRRPASILASHLEYRYRSSGYLAARVEGSFDAATGALVLTVDEGRLSEVVLEGVAGGAEVRARRELGLEPGTVLKEGDVWKALDRLESASRGAVASQAEDPFKVSQTPAGARLDLRLRTRRTRVSVGPFGPRTAGLYNRVDGLNPGLRTSFTLTDPASYDDLDVYAQASYALAAEKPRFALGSRRSFGHDRFTLGYEFHDLTDNDDNFRGSPLRGAETTALFFTSFQDYFRRRGHEAYAFVRLNRAAQLGVNWRRDDYGSLPLTTDGNLLFSATPRPNSPVDDGRMQSWIATARWTSARDLFGSVETERESYLLRSQYGTSFAEPQSMRAEATFETASAGGGGDFEFHRLIADVRGHRPLGSSAVTLRLLLGLTGGAPPLQKRFALGGRGTLRGYSVKEFPGENMAVANLEWEAGPARFPRPGLVLFYDGGKTWGGPVTSDGWKSGAGVAFEWSFSGFSLLRIDVGTRLGPTDGHHRVTVLARLRAPF